MSDGIEKELPSNHMAEILPFPEPGSKQYTLLKLASFRKQLAASGVTHLELDVIDSISYLVDLELAGVQWDSAGEPIFYLLDPNNPVQCS